VQSPFCFGEGLMLQGSHDIQTNTLRIFTVLHALRQDWGGALILCCGLNQQGAALALAANIAGAVCLCLEENPDLCRQALRTGACDFIVNTLDEALRTMKNEVRKHQPLSVGLQGSIAAALQELLTRGVLPELCTNLTADPGHNDVLRHFQSLGAPIIHFGESTAIEGALEAQTILDAVAAEKHWGLYSFPFDTTAALRAFDARALAALPAEDNFRRRWLHAAPRILQRERPIHRVLWLTEQEKQSLPIEATAAI
jgi:hypothetical protein